MRNTNKTVFVQLSSPVYPNIEKKLIDLALRKHTTVVAAAAWLGVGRATFYNMARRNGVHITHPVSADRFESALKVLLGSAVRVPHGFWFSPSIEHVFHDAHQAFREKAKLLHPDNGGDAGEMAVLNEAWQVVREAFERHGIE